MNDFLDITISILALVFAICLAIGIPLGIIWFVLWMLMTFWPVILVLAVIGAIAQLLNRR